MPTRTAVDYLKLAALQMRHSFCAKGGVGCVITNDAGSIIGTGYNQVITQPATSTCDCNGECKASHAEWDAVLDIDIPRNIHAAYITKSPCWHCTKMLALTGCKYIHFREESAEHDKCKAFWEGLGNFWFKIAL